MNEIYFCHICDALGCEPCIREVNWFYWRRENDSWRDLTSGLLWHPKIVGVFTWDEARKLESEWAMLPTSEIFEMAGRRGLNDIFGISEGAFWSSLEYEFNAAFAYAFSGADGFLKEISKKHYCSIIFVSPPDKENPA